MLLQFDRFSLIEGVLHHQVILHGDEVQQLVLPHYFQTKVLKSIHDDSGHQGLERTLGLVESWVFQPNMFKDVDTYLLNCEHCQVSKGNYVGPKTQLGSLSAKQPLELLCIDFTKADPSKGGKENVLVLMDAFSKFSQAFVTNNQKALMVTKILVDKWFNVYGIPSRIHSDLGRSFDNEIISNLCKMYGIRQSTTTPYNPHGNSQCKQFNQTLFGLLKSLNKEKKPNWLQHLPSLVFMYNVTPHSTTGFQPYELMFGCKAPMPCDAWLRLAAWLGQQLDTLVSVNKCAIKSIQKTTLRNKLRVGGDELHIPIGNHVLLRDHPKG